MSGYFSLVSASTLGSSYAFFERWKTNDFHLGGELLPQLPNGKESSCNNIIFDEFFASVLLSA
jgi:hypothetical protein